MVKPIVVGSNVFPAKASSSQGLDRSATIGWAHVREVVTKTVPANSRFCRQIPRAASFSVRYLPNGRSIYILQGIKHPVQ
jgi:hypothetical protein